MSTPDKTDAELNETNLDLYNQAQEAQVLAPRVKGKFALFDTPDGGIHVAYRPDGADADEHIEVPGHVMKIAKMFGEGKITNPMEMIKLLGKGGFPK